MDRQLENRELISDLADGLLEPAEAELALAMLAQDEDAQLSWEIYHLSRDVLRGEWGTAAPGAEVAADLAPDFMGRLRARLAQEQIEAPATVLPQAMPPAAPVLQPQPVAEAANQPEFRWRVLAGVSTAMAVAAVAWALVGAKAGGQAGAQLAAVQPAPAAVQAVAVALPGDERAVMLRDPRLDELMAAHKQMAGGSALQMSAGFLRNATFEEESR